MRKLNQLLSLRGYVFVLQAAALAVMVALSLSLAGCSTQGESSLAGAVVTRSPISDQAALSVETVRARIRTRPAIERRVIAPLRLPALSLAITPEVLVELKFYSGPNFAYISRAYERRKKYIDMLEREFRVAGVPRSLLHVAVVESCFDPHARSRSGATGMWQFMKPTARKYGRTGIGTWLWLVTTGASFEWIVVLSAVIRVIFGRSYAKRISAFRLRSSFRALLQQVF